MKIEILIIISATYHIGVFCPYILSSSSDPLEESSEFWRKLDFMSFRQFKLGPCVGLAHTLRHRVCLSHVPIQVLCHPYQLWSVASVEVAVKTYPSFIFSSGWRRTMSLCDNIPATRVLLPPSRVGIIISHSFICSTHLRQLYPMVPVSVAAKAPGTTFNSH